MAEAHFAPWEQATHFAGRAQPGARALMAAILLTDPAHLKSWGIYSARNTALGNLSAHAEGRALDIGCGMAAGENLVHKLLHLEPGPFTLGISVIIHNRRIYSARTPQGRPYVGVPHLDHVHIEQNRKQAGRLSLARAKRVLRVGL